MDRRVLLGAGAAVVVAAGALAYVTNSRPGGGGGVSGCNVDQVLGYVLPAGTALHHAAPDTNLLTGTCTVRDVSATLPDGAVLTADIFTLSSPDPRALHDVFDPAAYTNGRPAWTERRLLVSDASADGVHLQMAGPGQPRIALRSLVLHRLSGRPFALPPTPANRALPSFKADAALAFAVDSVSGSDLAVDGREATAPGGKPFLMNAGNFHVSDYDGGKLGVFAVKDVSVRTPPGPEAATAPPGTMSAKPSGAMSAKPSGAMSAQPSGAMSAKPSGTMSAKPSGAMSAKPSGAMSAKPSGAMSAKPSGAMSAQPPAGAGAAFALTLQEATLKDGDAHGLLDAVQQTGAAVQGSRAGFTYSSATLSGMELHVQAGPVVTLHELRAVQGVPDSAGLREGNATLTGLTMALGQTPVPPAAAPVLAAFGMDAITLDITATSKRQAGGQTEIAEDVMLHDLGTLHLKAAFTAGSLPTQPGMTGAMVSLLSNTLNQASVVWDDASLTERVFKVAAAQQHSTPELVRAELAIPLLTMGVLVPNQPDVAQQLTAFLDHPHTLTVTMKPPQPVTLGAVARAPVTDRASLLGVHVAGN